MKRIMLLGLVVGLFAGQAFAGMYVLDAPTARQFTQAIAINSNNALHLVMDADGTPGSATYFDDGYFDNPTADYGDTPMLLQVGFAGHIQLNHVMFIGKSGNLSGFDSFGINIANDNDDSYRYHAWVSFDNLATKVQGAPVSVLPNHHQSFVSVNIVGTAPVTNFGFDVELLGDPSDDFHTSVVPVPAALLLGFLGLGAAGVKLRRFA
jgi:hypothetical protein